MKVMVQPTPEGMSFYIEVSPKEGRTIRGTTHKGFIAFGLPEDVMHDILATYAASKIPTPPEPESALIVP